MMFRMARRYDVQSDSILFANNQPYTRDSYSLAGMGETIEDMLRFCRQMYAMKVDNAEYALLTAIVIFSGEWWIAWWYYCCYLYFNFNITILKLFFNLFTGKYLCATNMCQIRCFHNSRTYLLYVLWVDVVEPCYKEFTLLRNTHEVSHNKWLQHYLSETPNEDAGVCMMYLKGLKIASAALLHPNVL